LAYFLRKIYATWTLLEAGGHVILCQKPKKYGVSYKIFTLFFNHSIKNKSFPHKERKLSIIFYSIFYLL